MTSRDAERRAFLERAVPGRRVPVARTFPSDCMTPVMVFQRLRAPNREAFLLESVEGGESVARYTFLGAEPAARFTVREGVTSVERGGKVETLAGTPLDILERLVRHAPFVSDPELPPLTAGAVGYLAYDAVRLFETIPDRHPRETGMPDALFLLFDAVVAFDHPRQRLLLLTTVDPAGGAVEVDVERAIERLDRLEQLVFSASWPGTGDAPALVRFEPVAPRERFLAAVAETREAIAAGEVYQAVISQRWTARLDLDPFDVYRALRTLNPSPYLFYLETREASVLGSSPEMLVRCRGRRSRDASHRRDRCRAAALPRKTPLWRQLFWLIPRSVPSTSCSWIWRATTSAGSARSGASGCRATRRSRSSRTCSIWCRKSTARWRPAATAADLLRACFPAGTLTGAPKIRAMELIDELESARRGVYGGAVGYFDAAGNCDMAIAIRTAVVEDGICRIQAGAGIVADSIPEKEYAEAEAKAKALFAAVDLAREWFASSPQAEPKLQAEVRSPKSA